MDVICELLGSAYTLPSPKEFGKHPGELKDRHDLRRMIDGYDCRVRHMDDNIGMILAILEKKGILDDTVIIVTADHGENMGELGIYGEHGTADQGTCRIVRLSSKKLISGVLSTILLLYPVLQKFFTKGIVIGGALEE